MPNFPFLVVRRHGWKSTADYNCWIAGGLLANQQRLCSEAVMADLLPVKAECPRETIILSRKRTLHRKPTWLPTNWITSPTPTIGSGESNFFQRRPSARLISRQQAVDTHH